MIRRALIAGLFIAALSPSQPLRIGVFGLFRPAELTVSPAPGTVLLVTAGAADLELSDGETMRCAARNQAVECVAGGETWQAPVVFAAPRAQGDFILAVPGRIERRFRGSLEIRVPSRALEPVVTVDLETAVASAVLAETRPGTPLPALEAQAVVTRSYYVAARGRHAGFDFCDTTHCQFFRRQPPPEDAASRAARSTAGLVLTWSGRPFAALFSASCGGRTRALSQSSEEYPYFAVDCPFCPRTRHIDCTYCTRSEGPWANRRGAGAGHGIGLCQSGARIMAASGANFLAILSRYYPNTTLKLIP
jgi:peptidoglycan hydrolase-like amidase